MTAISGVTLEVPDATSAHDFYAAAFELDAGVEAIKPVQKSMWGYGGVVEAPDGALWKVATSAKNNTGPATRHIDQIVLLLGAEDVIASKRFYVDHGLTVGKSFVRTYVEFDNSSSPVRLALYRRSALAKDAGVSPEGRGSHRMSIGSDGAPFTDRKVRLGGHTTDGRRQLSQPEAPPAPVIKIRGQTLPVAMAGRV